MRRFIFLIMLLLPFVSTAQKRYAASTMRFETNVWNFGTIREADGVVSHTFVFTNTGKQPFVIENVATTCGCTTPKFSRAPIMPGKQGSIEVSYDPEGRPGSFRKDITVTSNNRANRNTLTITGNVIARPQSPEEAFPVECGGGIRLDKTHQAMGYVGRFTTKSLVYRLYNGSGKSIDISVEPTRDRSWYGVAIGSNTISADSTIDITVLLTPRAANAWGMLTGSFYVNIDGRRCKEVISVSAVAVDDFSGMSSEERAAAPVGVVSPVYHDFGTLRAGEKKTASFSITNEGVEPLVVRFVSCSDGVASDLTSGSIVGSGKTRTFTVTVTGEPSLDMKMRKNLIIIMNDPKRPMVDMRLAADIAN